MLIPKFTLEIRKNAPEIHKNSLENVKFTLENAENVLEIANFRVEIAEFAIENGKNTLEIAEFTLEIANCRLGVRCRSWKVCCMECVGAIDWVVSVAPSPKLLNETKLRFWQTAIMLSDHECVPSKQRASVIGSKSVMPSGLVVRPHCKERE